MEIDKGHGEYWFWPVLFSMAVAFILIVSGVYMLGHPAPQRKLSVELVPDHSSILTNESMDVTLSVLLDGNGITGDPSAAIHWSVVPLQLVDIVDSRPTGITLKAGMESAEVLVNCTVYYQGLKATGFCNVSVMLHNLESFSLSPASFSAFRGETQTVRAVALSDKGIPIPGATPSWRLEGANPDCAVINKTDEMSVTVTTVSAGNATLVASMVYNGTSMESHSDFLVVEPLRAVTYRWYDMFNVSFGGWWNQRWNATNVEEPLSTSYPYIFRWHGAPAGNNRYYSNMRLNVTGPYLTEINMGSNPEFLPFLGSQRGGTAEIDWYMQYLTHEEVHRYYTGPDISSWDDGWLIRLNGTVSLDKQGAKSVLGLNDSGYDDFDSWWGINNGTVAAEYLDWLKYEGNVRLDIYPMYEYSLSFLYYNFWVTKADDEIVVHYDYLTWGMEALMTRWLHESFMPIECWFEDMDFHALITEAWCNLSIDTAVAYAVYAWESTEYPGQPAWIWEPMLQDRVSWPGHWSPLYETYRVIMYQNRAPGSAWFGRNMTYDYVPTAFNLSANELLRIEWPAGNQSFIAQTLNSTGEPVLGSTYNISSQITVNPVPGPWDMSSITLDNVSRVLEFLGPANMWQWSKDQTAHPWLHDRWQELGILPCGIPWVEFYCAP